MTTAKRSASRLVQDLTAALARPKPSEPRRRVIAAVMLIQDCTFEEAAAGLEAAVQRRLEREPGSIMWNNTTSLTVWVESASWYTADLRRRRMLGLPGNVVQLFPEVAP